MVHFLNATKLLPSSNGEYAHLKMWHANGQLIHESHYVDGKQEGDAIGFHPNGQVKYTGRYSAGKHVGTWKRYTAIGPCKPVAHEYKLAEIQSTPSLANSSDK